MISGQAGDQRAVGTEPDLAVGGLGRVGEQRLGDAADLVNLIICDWRMPRLSGIELLRQIRTVDPAIRFLMLTGLATPDSVAAARDLGVSAYLKKPCSPEQLETRLLTLADGVDE